MGVFIAPSSMLRCWCCARACVGTAVGSGASPYEGHPIQPRSGAETDRTWDRARKSQSPGLGSRRMPASIGRQYEVVLGDELLPGFVEPLNRSFRPRVEHNLPYRPRHRRERPRVRLLPGLCGSALGPRRTPCRTILSCRRASGQRPRSGSRRRRGPGSRGDIRSRRLRRGSARRT